MEISLINVNFLHKSVILTWFSEIIFLKHNQSSRNNPYTKQAYFGVAYSVPLTWMYPSFLMCSSVEGHTDFFKFLAILNRDAMLNCILFVWT